MPRVRGRRANIGRRSRQAQLVHNRRLRRRAEEDLTDNVNLRDQVANTRANENPEQHNQMPPKRCSYFLCNESVKTTPGLRKFYFPIHDLDRCQQWLINSGNDLIHIPLEKLRGKFICEKHFRKEHIFAKKLVREAIPISYEFRPKVNLVTYSKKERKKYSSQLLTDFEKKLEVQEISVSGHLGNLDCPNLIKTFETDRADKETEKNKKINIETPTPEIKSAKKIRNDANNLYGFESGLEPEKIIGATESSAALMFLMKWVGTDVANLVPAKQANMKCPQLVIKFYEERISWKLPSLSFECQEED